MATLTRTSLTHVLNEIRLVNKLGAALWLAAVAGLISLIVLLTIAISDGRVPSQDRTVLDWTGWSTETPHWSQASPRLSAL